MLFFYLIFLSEVLIALLIAAIGILNFRKLTKGLKMLALLLLFSGLADLLALITVYVFRFDTNMPVLIVYNVLGVVFSSLTFYYISRTTIIKNLIKLISILLLGYCISMLFINGFYKFDNIGNGLNNLAWIIFSVALFFEIFHFADQDNLLRYPTFWIICGFLIYAAGTLFLYLLENYEVWYLHNIIIIIKYLLFGKAIWEELKTNSLLES